MIFIRGATTIDFDSKENVLNETKILIEEIIIKNNLNIDDILAITFTGTKDIKSVYPAVAAREIGITKASLMCFQEMDIIGSLEKCIRVSITANSNKKQKDVNHVYLNNAKNLRPDIINN